MPLAINLPTETSLARRGALAAAFGAMFVLMRRDGGSVQASSPPANLAESELRRAAQRGELCGAGNAAGVGLRGEYFSGELMHGATLLVRLDGLVDFDASLDWPAGRGNERPHSARWMGWVKPPLSGSYRFHADAPNARVLVARQVLAGADAPPAAHIDMAAGRYYPITVELQRIGTGINRMRLEWTAPHGARFVVPRPLLYPPSEMTTANRS